MIGMVLFSFLVAPVRIPDDSWEEAEVSLVQAYRLLTRFATRLLQHLTEEAGFARLLQQVLDQWVRLARKQKRRKRPNVCQRLAEALA
jgi:hypothetical protein